MPTTNTKPKPKSTAKPKSKSKSTTKSNAKTKPATKPRTKPQQKGAGFLPPIGNARSAAPSTGIYTRASVAGPTPQQRFGANYTLQSIAYPKFTEY